MHKTTFLDFYVTTNAFIPSVTTAHIVGSVFVKFHNDPCEGLPSALL